MSDLRNGWEDGTTLPQCRRSHGRLGFGLKQLVHGGHTLGKAGRRTVVWDAVEAVSLSQWKETKKKQKGKERKVRNQWVDRCAEKEPPLWTHKASHACYIGGCFILPKRGPGLGAEIRKNCKTMACLFVFFQIYYFLLPGIPSSLATFKQSKIYQFNPGSLTSTWFSPESTTNSNRMHKSKLCFQGTLNNNEGPKTENRVNYKILWRSRNNQSTPHDWKVHEQ